MVPEYVPATKVPFPKAAPANKLVVPEVLEVQVVPLSDEVRMVPSAPTATKVLFPKATPLRELVVPEVLEVQEDPLSDEA